ncbi:MAG: NAD(P)H-hydrate dehydratase [Clostridia bacterium]|nr:NAD(P)H-hydrate dehydratase [Clostridia bacterium]
MSEYTQISNNDCKELLLPDRPHDSHKGTFGRVLVVAGSHNMAGAAYFAAKACYRMGAGLCRILTVKENFSVLASLLPEALLTCYDGDDPDPDVIAEAEEWADVLVIGCGMGTSEAARRILSYLLRHTDKPRVLDADALNLLARNPSLLKYARGAILTPHSMEMARLCGCGVEEVESSRAKIAHGLAKRTDSVCVLKGHRTLITDGKGILYRNETGNSGMATAGSGDVLAGMIGGLLAGGHLEEPDPLRWARLGVCLHGLCGEAASEELTEYAVMASDLLDAIPSVLRMKINEERQDHE